jgi:hypothetical protein
LEGCELLFFEWPKHPQGITKTEPKESTPYDLVATRLPCASRLHWRKNKLARFAPSDKFLLNPMQAAMLGCIEGAERRRRLKEFVTFNSTNHRHSREGGNPLHLYYEIKT